MKQGLNLSLVLFMSLSPQEKQHQAGDKSQSDQYNLNTMASLGLAVVENPQFAAKLPMARPFPPEQQSDQPQCKQSSHKEQGELGVNLRPIEKCLSLAAHRLIYVGNANCHVYKP